MPPDIKDGYSDNHWWSQAMLIVYNQIREHEEGELFHTLIKAICGVPRL